jgi:hypothetical protein
VRIEFTKSNENHHFKIDDGPWTIYNKPIIISINGVHCFQYYSGQEAIKLIYIRIDYQAPTIEQFQIDREGQGQYLLHADLQDFISGVSSAYFFKKSINGIEYFGPDNIIPYEIEINATSGNTVGLIAFDYAGNNISYSEKIPFFIFGNENSLRLEKLLLINTLIFRN